MQHGASQGLRSTFLLTALLTLTSVLRWPRGLDEQHLTLTNWTGLVSRANEPSFSVRLGTLPRALRVPSSLEVLGVDGFSLSFSGSSACFFGFNGQKCENEMLVLLQDFFHNFLLIGRGWLSINMAFFVLFVSSTFEFSGNIYIGNQEVLKCYDLFDRG